MAATPEHWQLNLDTSMKMDPTVAQAVDKIIFDAMHEAYNARMHAEASIYTEIRALGFQHPPEMFAWCREIFAIMRAQIIRTPGADPAAPINVQLRRGLYPESPGVCIECRNEAHINQPASDPNYSICYECMRNHGFVGPQTISEAFNGVPDAYAAKVEPMIFRRRAQATENPISRDESFLTGTKLAPKKSRQKK